MACFNQKGAAALIASVIVTAGILSIALSATLVAINNKHSLDSYTDSLQSFYAAESGLGESLLHLRRNPKNYNFPVLTVAGFTVGTRFIEDPECTLPPCGSNIEATASSTRATRKVMYNCNNLILDCVWRELIPAF